MFLLPAETAHQLSMQALGLAGAWHPGPLLAREVPYDPVEVMGITFPNRVGLAAGLDKDAQAIAGLAALGFGFVEVGTVTPRPQPGNPKPRLFRLPQQQAIINRMGFNNRGVEALVRRVRHSRFNGVLGVNIGKNLDTPVTQALQDYQTCLRRVYRVASYIVVNISSPNTPGLRGLQQEGVLPGLLAGLKAAHLTLVERHGRSVPLLVKIAPDMTDEALGTLCRQLVEFELDGVIVGNTTTDRSQLHGSDAAGYRSGKEKAQRHIREEGGLSGRPLRSKANHALRIAADVVRGKMAIIGVGGITEGADAAEKIRLGADLVQLYTGLIYRGPGLIFDSVKAIREA